MSLFPLSDAPEAVFAPKAQVLLLNLEGETVAGPLTIERSRGYHREWLVKFVGIDGRDALEGWRGLFLAVHEAELRPWKVMRSTWTTSPATASGCRMGRRLDW